jgi:hypothetical protein
MRPKITHVAIRFEGVVYSLPQPNRHHDVIRFIVNTTGATHVDAHGEDQGFLDESGAYLTRQQALVSALLNGQVKQPNQIRLGMLFSEDVW